MLRSEIGMTQTEFAAAVYVSFSAVNRWENKEMRPNKMQSKAIIDLAKMYHVSASCLDALTKCLLAPRVDDKEDRERMKEEVEQIKTEQRDYLTAEQFKKTMDNIDMALVGQRFYNVDPATCDVFYYNSYFSKSFGYTASEFDELLRRQTFFAIAPESRWELIGKLRDLLAHKIDLRDFSVTVQAIRKDSSTFWLEVRAASLTEYSYGQEVFTSFRDVTRRVEAERRYNEEVLLRDVSMQIVYSNIHCDLTANRVSRYSNIAAWTGREHSGETFDILIRSIADAAQDGDDKERFLKTFSREALIRAYGRGEVYGNIVLYNKNVRRWFRNEYLVVKNPANGNIHALIYIFDIQRQILSENILGIFLDEFFDFVGLIDIETETVEAYYYDEGVFREKHSGPRLYRSICDEKFRLFGYKEESVKESEAVELQTVRARLEKVNFYSTVLHLRGYDGQPLQKKVTYTYLDGNRNTIIMAQSDLGALEKFMMSHKLRYSV